MTSSLENAQRIVLRYQLEADEVTSQTLSFALAALNQLLICLQEARKENVALKKRRTALIQQRDSQAQRQKNEMYVLEAKVRALLGQRSYWGNVMLRLKGVLALTKKRIQEHLDEIKRLQLLVQNHSHAFHTHSSGDEPSGYHPKSRGYRYPEVRTSTAQYNFIGASYKGKFIQFVPDRVEGEDYEL